MNDDFLSPKFEQSVAKTRKIDSKPIKQFSGPNRWLSNFYIVPILYLQRTYPSVEHAYQAQKSDSQAWKEYCANPMTTPYDVKKDSYKQQLVPNWDNIKLGIMDTLLRIKFNTPELMNKLLETRDADIQEGNNWNDTFWGVDLLTGQGHNHLGRLIMDIRSDLQKKSNPVS